ncbi:hypothetical protein GGX14DRAFT_575443 [Mycena pura]|uniref:intramembrane prenyl-peptidase Rce1 n=1 Tax=Mycena pura TaxID=153505 RepID=A0AAD6Y836_9AGAR|nr:hypothetical protein GGX14DRAFT_575443 [Mycena pura]
MISMLFSHLLALVISSSYVGSLYIVGKIQPGSRDQPAVIRARLSAVTITSTLSCAVVYFLIASSNLDHPFEVTMSTLLLFLGPLYTRHLAYILPGQNKPSLIHELGMLCTWLGFRNYVWAPLTEEIVFRACVLAVYAMGGAARWKMIAFAPLVFGLAHVHHGWEVFTRFGRTKAAFKRAAISALFQTAYTTLFGAHASFLFLRTSSLVPPLIAHIFCNTMGLPQPGVELKRFPAHKKSIITAYVLGILLFAGTLVPWTEVPARMASLYWSSPADFWILLRQRRY